MATTLNFKDIIDLPEWRPLAIAPNGDGTGRGLACDLRNNEDCHPHIFHLASAGILENYDVKSDGWLVIGSPGLTGAFGAGAGSVFAPQRGPRGTIGSGSSTKTVVLGTALPAAVGVNQLSDRGDGRGFKIRIIGNASGSSGKTEERLVVGNTGGLTPAVTLDTPLSFTPTAGCAYEFLSGRVYLLGAGTIASGIWKYYDILTNSFSGNLSVTNLPSTIGTDSNFVCLDELHVPSSQAPGGGYFGILTATNISSTTLTGRATGGDATVAANEFRNFQIRIVTDTAKPQAVGQRRKISSHTAGPSPVYTVPAWAVTPSATAVYVVENSNEVLLWTSASATTFTYAQDATAGGQSADTWSTTTYSARPEAVGAGLMAFHAFGLASLDPDKNARYSMIYAFRGGASNALDVLDLAGGANGLWTGAVAYGGPTSSGGTFTTGSSLVYDPVSAAGKYAYICLNGTNTFLRFNAASRVLQRWAQLRFAQSTATAGQKMAFAPFVDGSTKAGFVYTIRSSGNEFFNCLIHR